MVAGTGPRQTSGIWDTVILLSFIPLGLFGFDMADWMDDMRRSVNPTRIAYNLPFIFLPVFYVGFLMANILFGVFSLSGMCITFFGALGLRLFGYYEMSGKGKASLIAIGFTVLGLFLLLPHRTGACRCIQVCGCFPADQITMASRAS